MIKREVPSQLICLEEQGTALQLGGKVQCQSVQLTKVVDRKCALPECAQSIASPVYSTA